MSDLILKKYKVEKIYGVYIRHFSLQFKIVHFTLYTLNFTLYILRFTVSNFHFTLTLHFTLYTLHLHFTL